MGYSMLDYFYRKDDQDIFTGRRKELSLIARHLLGERPADIHISGLRRIGKTMLLKEFIKSHIHDKSVLPVYINLEEIAETPEDFALKFVGWHIYWHYAKGDRLPTTFLHLPSLLFEVPDNDLRNALMPITHELEKGKPDRQRLLQECFGFSSVLARFTKKRVILFLDEFQEIQTLRNFDQTKNILKVMRGIKDRAQNVTYCISGSIVSEMEYITRDGKSPLFNQFTHIPLLPYSREESRELIDKFLQTIDNRNAGLLHHYSNGYPFYLVQILIKVKMFLEKGEMLSENLVKRAFISETLSPGGLIHSYCNYLYNISLQKARGYGVLKSLLDTIALAEEPLTQSELARELRMSQGQVRINLKELENIGLLFEKNRRYFFHDPLLRYWVAYVQNGIEVADFPREKDLLAIIEDLDKKYQLVSAELGKEKEESIKELMKLFTNQDIEGSLFGIKGPLTLSKFRKIDKYISADGKTEIDILAENKIRWAVEIKWKTKAAGVKEIDSFFRKASPLAKKCWYISKAGFTEEAKALASQKGILFSAEKELQILENKFDKI